MVSVTPTRVPLSLSPGESATVPVTVINQGSGRLLLLPRILEVLGGEGEPPVLATSERCLWVEPEGEELFLEPHSKVDFTFRVQPPPGSPQGNYRFALAFIPRQEKPGAIAFTGGLAVLLELEVLPPPPSSGSASYPYVLLAVGSVLSLLLAAFILGRERRRRESRGEA
ncbi:hypothetical protein [Candidatus Solincola sp.]|nr:hypothetical protein [Actinomycetota bacterium]